MSDGVLVTMVLTIKPEATAAFIPNLQAMFADTKLRKGFRNIKVERHQMDANKLLVVEEWDTAQDYQDYIAWRTERGDMESIGEVLAAPPQLDIWTKRVAEA